MNENSNHKKQPETVVDYIPPHLPAELEIIPEPSAVKFVNDYSFDPISHSISKTVQINNRSLYRVENEVDDIVQVDFEYEHSESKDDAVFHGNSSLRVHAIYLKKLQVEKE